MAAPARRDRCPAKLRLLPPGSLRPTEAPRTARSTTARNKSPPRVPTISSSLLQLDQRAEKILRVQKQDRLAVGADFGFAVAEHACTFCFHLIARGADVGDLVAKVM